MVIAGEDDTRILLRGLVRLHRFRVVGEAAGVSDTLALLRAERPTTLVADSQLAEGSAEELVREMKRRFPSVRLVLVTHDSARREFPAGGGPDAVLRRPFRIQEFAAALQPSERPG